MKNLAPKPQIDSGIYTILGYEWESWIEDEEEAV
jgi:hypothetical protein